MKTVGVLILILFSLGQAVYAGEPPVYHIYTAEQLAQIQAQANLYIETSGARGSLEYLSADFVLRADIELPKGWTPIGDADTNAQYAFRGSFDGAGFTVRGLDISAQKGVTQGFFGRVENAEIRNLVLEGASLCLTGEYGRREFAAGLLAGEIIGGSVENIRIIGGYIAAAPPDSGNGVIGGMVGKAVDTEIKNITVQDIRLIANDELPLRAVGGMAGQLENCVVQNVQVIGGEVRANALSVGGVAGLTLGGVFRGSGTTLMNVSGTETAGGFVGSAQDSGVFESCHSVAFVSGGIAGGFAGRAANSIAETNAAEFTRCRAFGQVKASPKNGAGGWAGGFAGTIAYASLNRCAAYADVRLSDGLGAGGFVGRLAGRSRVSHSLARGDVNAVGGIAGGFVGEITNSSRIEFSSASGIVQGCTAAGGFVGVVSDTGAPNTITASVTFSPAVKGLCEKSTRRFAGLLRHDGINGCFAYLGTVVIADGAIANVIPGPHGADGGDLKLFSYYSH